MTERPENHWSWLQFPDKIKLTRLYAIARQAAIACGLDSDRTGFDFLRRAEFVNFKFIGRSQTTRSEVPRSSHTLER